MPTINPSLPSNGDDATVDPYNAAFQAVLAVLNGAIDEDNLAAGAVILSKLSSAVQAALVPAGTILAYGGSAAPTGYLLCYGQAVSRSTYSDLFAVIGTSFGVGNGTTTFNLPDLRGRVAVGAEAMGGTAANRAQNSTTISTTNGSPTATVGSASGLTVGDVIVSTNVPAGTTITAISGTTITMSGNASATASGTAARFSLFGNDAQTVGATGGVRTHAISVAQLASHFHVLNNSNVTTNFSPAAGAGTGGPFNNSNSNSTGNDQPHPNMQPSQVVNYIVKT